MANNNNTNKKVSTQGIQLYNENMGSTLMLNLYDRYATMRICPTLTNPQDGRVYDYDTFINCGVDAIQGNTLKKIAMRVAADIEEGNYDFKSRGIKVSSNYIEICPISKLVKGGIYRGKYELAPDAQGVALVFYLDFAKNGGQDKSKVFYYVFNKDSAIENMDVNTNDFEFGEIIETEFDVFITYLDEAIKAATNAVAHSIRNVNHYSDKYTRDSIGKLLTKFGLNEQYNNNNNNYNRSNNNFYDNSNANGGNNNNNYNPANNSSDAGFITESELDI